MRIQDSSTNFAMSEHAFRMISGRIPYTRVSKSNGVPDFGGSL